MGAIDDAEADQLFAGNHGPLLSAAFRVETLQGLSNIQAKENANYSAVPSWSGSDSALSRIPINLQCVDSRMGRAKDTTIRELSDLYIDSIRQLQQMSGDIESRSVCGYRQCITETDYKLEPLTRPMVLLREFCEVRRHF